MCDFCRDLGKVCYLVSVPDPGGLAKGILILKIKKLIEPCPYCRCVS